MVRFSHKTCGHKGRGAGLGSGKDPREKRRKEITHEEKLGRVEVKSIYSPLHMTWALVGLVHCVFPALSP